MNIRVSVTGLEDEEKERNGIYWKDQQDDDRRECRQVLRRIYRENEDFGIMEGSTAIVKDAKGEF